jgi:hypothetical protein
MTRLKASPTLSNHDIKFRTASGMSSSTITIDLGTSGGFVKESGLDYTDIDLQYGSSQAEVNGACSSNCLKATLAAAAGAGAWGAALDGSSDLTLTYPSSAGTPIATNDYVRVLIGTNATTGTTGDKQMTNPGTGTKIFTINVAGTTDTGKIAVSIVANDQFTVSASVDPTITFSLDNTSTAFGILTTSVSTSSPNIIATVITNAASGYTLSILDQGSGTNPGLYKSVGGTYTIGSGDYSYNNAADLGSVAGYGIQASSATATVDARYDKTGNNVGGYEITAQTLATYGSPTDTSSVTIISKAKVTGSTPAGSYTDTVTVVATGNF